MPSFFTVKGHMRHPSITVSREVVTMATKCRHILLPGDPHSHVFFDWSRLELAVNDGRIHIAGESTAMAKWRVM